MFFTETHLHTYPTSGCSRLSPKEAVECYQQDGYSTLFITNHFAGWFGRNTELSWAEKVDLFFQGYEDARMAGDAMGVCVLPAMELTLKTAPNDYLLYGVTKEFFLDKPDISEMTPQKVYALAKKAGIFVVQAHPCRGKSIPTPDCVDALEVINTSPRHDNQNETVRAIAKEYGLPMTSGSDAHRPEDVARGGVMTKKQILSVKDYVEALRAGSLQLKGE